MKGESVAGRRSEKGELPRSREEVWEKHNGTGSRTRKKKRSTTGSGVAKGPSTGRRSKKGEVPQ